MPTKQGQRAEVNSFVGGLITDASVLNFPPNASSSEQNFELLRDGTRRRRLGHDYEPKYLKREVPFSFDSLSRNTAVNTFRWEGVAGDTSLKFLVIQINSRIYIHDLSKEDLSRTGFVGTVNLFSGQTLPSTYAMNFSSIDGSLVVAAGVGEIAVVSYNKSSRNFSTEYGRIKTRDVWGVQVNDSLIENDDSARRPFNIFQYYNNQNQSWGIERKARVTTKVVSGIGFPTTRDEVRTIDPQIAYNSHYGVYPSTNEQVWAGLQFQPVTYEGENRGYSDPYERMFLNLYKEALGSETSPSRGYFVIDALNRGASRKSAYEANRVKYPTLGKDIIGRVEYYFVEEWVCRGEGLDRVCDWETVRKSRIVYDDVVTFNPRTDRTTGGATVVTEYAGRVFFSGFSGEVVGGDSRSPDFSNYIFFSKLVDSKKDIFTCHQVGDPTSRDTSEIVDTDGGFLRVSEAIGIHSLLNLGDELIVIASNGVWSITGGSGYGFSATNYKVTRLSSFGGRGGTSVVIEGSDAYFWAEDAIYNITKNEYGDRVVENITINRIQEWYDSIGQECKSTARGLYDKYNKQVRWVLSTTSGVKELILDSNINAYSVYEVQGDVENLFLGGIFEVPYLREESAEEGVLVGGELVQVGSEPVVLSVQERHLVQTYAKYLVISKKGNVLDYSFSYYRDVDFRDWKSIDGVGHDAFAFCETGMQTLEDSGIMKQIPYLIMHLERTEQSLDATYTPTKQSSCMVRCKWDFANNVSSGKWTPLFQAYRYSSSFYKRGPEFDNGFEIVTTKNKIRGRGRAFSLYFETEPYKDCRIIGWNLTLNGNAKT